MQFGVLFAVVALLCFGGPAQREIEARHWFNNPIYRLHDDRTVILLFFECNDKESARCAKKLERFAKRHDDVVAIGLTADNRGATERFISRNKVRFTIGAESRSMKTFGVRRLPAILVVDGQDREQLEVVDNFAGLQAMLASWDEPSTKKLSEIKSEDGLKTYIETIAHGQSRESAVRKLWELLGTERAEEFVEFAEARLLVEPCPWVRGELRYWVNIAGGVDGGDRERSSWARCHFDFRDNPEAQRWSKYRAFREALPGYSPTELLEQYRQHLSDEANDVLIRENVVRSLHIEEGPGREQARGALMEILLNEPDRSIRLHATGTLGQICEVGDTEVADFLDTLAETEPYVLVVRAAMEYIAEYLRTGEEDGRFMRPRP